MAIDFNDPEAVRLYVADLEERDRKRQRLHEEIAILEEKVASLQEEKEEGAYLREEKEEAVQKINALVQENQGLKLETKTAKRETEGSPLLKYIKISQKTFRTKISGIINFRTSVYEVNEPDGEGLTGCREDIANLQPDRLRVCSNRDLVTGSTTLLYVCEFKPPRVVTITHVLDAFQPTTNLRQTLLNTSHEDAKGPPLVMYLKTGTRFRDRHHLKLRVRLLDHHHLKTAKVLQAAPVTLKDKVVKASETQRQIN
ncbi:hypothetical protein E4U32_007031 [Claviceps aff. humidiphila group G2b]|nr:hypothetical protein E4U32_007031 [Claviceps aff. humidiphila group G2b]